REARQRKEAAEGVVEAAAGEAMPELDMGTIDVTAASARTLLLLKTLVVVGVLASLWTVWSGLLPALEVLERVELTDAPKDGNGEFVESLTLWSVLLAVLALVLTAVAAHNLPAVLELAVLERFPIDHGARYAAVTLTRYITVAVGLLFVSNLMHL